MAKLTSRRRNKLPKKSFAMPGKRKYPIHDRAHAANALSRASARGGSTYAKVRAAVCRRYPSMPSCK
jgi:hypothetical protein